MQKLRGVTYTIASALVAQRLHGDFFETAARSHSELDACFDRKLSVEGLSGVRRVNRPFGFRVCDARARLATRLTDVRSLWDILV
jgi:hypothetical protein